MLLKRDESGQSTAATIFAVIGGIALLLAAVYAFGYFVVGFNNGPGKEIKKSENRIERQANQNSQQYIETQLRAMRDQIVKYDDLDVQIAQLQSQDAAGNAEVISKMRTQQQGIVTFVKAQTKTIPNEAVPSDIRQFLSSH